MIATPYVLTREKPMPRLKAVYAATDSTPPLLIVEGRLAPILADHKSFPEACLHLHVCGSAALLSHGGRLIGHALFVPSELVGEVRAALMPREYAVPAPPQEPENTHPSHKA